jgi:hypothetical protein
MEWDLIQWVTMVVGPAIGWLAARITRRVDSQKQLLDALDRQNKDIVKLYTEMGIIRRAVERRNQCRYINVCPVDYALRKSPVVDRKLHADSRQYCVDENSDSETYDGSSVTGRPPPEFKGFK